MAAANSQINGTDRDDILVPLAAQLNGGLKAPVHAQSDAAGNVVDPATSTLQTAAATLTGAVTETAPTTDTASSGLNGRLQRIAQRITSLIALLPTALGQSTMANSLRVVIASDQSAIPVSKSATIDDIADVTLNNGSETSLVAVDTTRREAIIVADTGNTVAIRIGKTGQVGAARGVALQPGQPIVLSTTAAIYGYAGAASQKVSITLLKD